ncbi:MAG: hypothetical protein II453_04725 [Alphaproteobacteria bacterium]|nr:hypothetical protein [Alphaproteobacteria bacterium]
MMQNTSISPSGLDCVTNACRTSVTYKAYHYAAANLHNYQPVTCRRRIIRFSVSGVLNHSALSLNL